MSRKQIQIPGTERTDVPEALLEAGEKWLDKRREKRRASEHAKEAKYGVLALMASHKVALFKLTDPETEEVMELEFDNEPKLRTKKTGSVESEVGDGLPQHSGPAVTDGVPQGLIAQAMRAQDEANGVEVTADGDVTVPETAAPKGKKRKSKPKKGGK